MTYTLLNAEQWAKAELYQLRTSKTVQALILLEGGSIAAFINGVVSGTQSLDFVSIKDWVLLQFAIIIAFFIRHTLAGIELKLNGAVDPVTVKAIEDGAIKTALDKLAVRDPVLSEQVKGHLNDTA